MPGESVPQGLWLPPRVATLLVAASDALDRTRAQADYICDGVADEVQINAALNALPAGEGRVMLSEGTFTLAAPIVIPGHYITLEGNNWATFIDGDGLATGNHGIVVSGFSYVQIKNLRIQTDDGGGKTCHCIFIEDGANEFVIDRVCIFESDSDGIHIEGTSINKGWIQDCYVEGADANGIFVDMDAGDIIQNLVIKKNIIHSCGVDGIHFWNTGGPEEHCLIEGNNIASCAGCGMYIWNGLYFTISGNVLDTNGDHGLRLQELLRSNIEGNIVYRSLYHGIYLDDSCDNVISGNNCSGNDSGDTGTWHSINVDAGSTNNQIIGNVCDLNHGRGLNISGANNGIIGNQCSTNDRCGIYCHGPECQINSNHVYDNGQDAPGTDHGIELGGSAANCQINNNHCDSPGDSQEDGINLGAGAHYIQVIGNYCANGMGDGIQVGNNDHCLIKDNFLYNNAGYGVNIGVAADCTTVENNKFEANTTGAINDAGTDTILPEVVIDAPNPDSNVGDFPAQSMLNNVDTEIRMKLHCPSEFQELVRAHIIVVPGDDGDLRRTVDTDWGKICANEVYNTDSGAIAAGQVAVTINELECIDITAALTGVGAIAAGDWIGILFVRIASHASDTVEATVWLLGLRMQYV